MRQGPTAGAGIARGNIPALLIGAALFCIFALVNRGPIYHHDTVGYIRGASQALEKVLHLPERAPDRSDPTATPSAPGPAGSDGQPAEGIKWSNRSIYFGLLLAVADRLEAIWLVLALHALLTAWLCLLLCRALSPGQDRRRVRRVFLGASCVGAIGTGLPFVAAYLMPDLLFGLVLLDVPLLLLFPDLLSRAERLGLAGVLAYAALSHGAAALLAVLLCGAAAVLARMLARRPVPAAAVLWVALAVGLGQAGNWAVDATVRHVFGRPALWPPFLLARVVADGPGTLWLREHCGAGADLALCAYVDALPPADADVFLWDTRPGIGVLAATDSETQRRIVAEQPIVVAGAITEHPLLQLSASLRNAGRQLLRFGIEEYRHDPGLREKLAELYPSQLDEFDRTLLTHHTPDWHALDALHHAVMLGSLLLMAALAWRPAPAGDAADARESRRRAALVLALVAGVVLNAAISGALSEPHDRYGARVAWVLPFAAAALALHRLSAARRREE